MNRRSFLLGTGTLALSQLAAGCGAKNQATLRVELLKGSIPSQLVNEFRQNLKQSAQVKFAPTEQLQALFDKLGRWQQQSNKSDQQPLLPLPFIKPTPALPPDLVTLGDYWLAPAIQQKLIRPLEPAHLKRLSMLPDRWQQLVRRNDQGQLDSQGKIWAAPYRWGSTVIAYNRDKFNSLGWTPKDWSDIWRPELRDRVSLLDQPREVIGLTLKKLGRSYNLNNLDQVPKLREELHALHQQVKFYSSDSYMQPLVLADTWLAVGWSTDVLPVVQRYQHIASVVPQSGTSLWADLWVRPTSAASNTSLSEQWIDFCWQPQTAQQISILSKATSPIPVKLDEADIQKGWRMTVLDSEVFKKSEFLLPLPETTVEQFQSLWQEMRS